MCTDYTLVFFTLFIFTDDGALYDTETFMLVFIVNKSWILKLCHMSCKAIIKVEWAHKRSSFDKRSHK